MDKVASLSLMEYFHQAVQEAIQRLRLQVSPQVEFYLTNLLTTFLRIERLRQAPGVGEERTYAELLLESSNYSLAQQARIFKYVGDSTLFRSGYFADSFKRKCVDVDYYASLGIISYQKLRESVAAEAGWEALEEVFSELAARFLELVDVIAEVSEAAGISSSQDLLRLYERYLRTRSRRAAERLREQGIQPLGDIGLDFIH